MIQTDVNHALSNPSSPGLMFHPSVMSWCCITQAFLTKVLDNLCPVGAVPLVSLVTGEGKQSAASSPAHLCRDPCSDSTSIGNENPSNKLKRFRNHAQGGTIGLCHCWREKRRYYLKLYSHEELDENKYILQLDFPAPHFSTATKKPPSQRINDRNHTTIS